MPWVNGREAYDSMEPARGARLVVLPGPHGQPHRRCPDRYAPALLVFVRDRTDTEGAARS
jgi:hypothetical protein